mmetsp:Transcript_69419/g.164790  ORF Transcript_69419/g.164790 Transcript_69419/m.164790 type:complete len:380 (-) Transcript_69419:251-1390(-)
MRRDLLPFVLARPLREPDGLFANVVPPLGAGGGFLLAHQDEGKPFPLVQDEPSVSRQRRNLHAGVADGWGGVDTSSGPVLARCVRIPLLAQPQVCEVDDFRDGAVDERVSRDRDLPGPEHGLEVLGREGVEHGLPVREAPSRLGPVRDMEPHPNPALRNLVVAPYRPSHIRVRRAPRLIHRRVEGAARKVEPSDVILCDHPVRLGPVLLRVLPLGGAGAFGNEVAHALARCSLRRLQPRRLHLLRREGSRGPGRRHVPPREQVFPLGVVWPPVLELCLENLFLRSRELVAAHSHRPRHGLRAPLAGGEAREEVISGCLPKRLALQVVRFKVPEAAPGVVFSRGHVSSVSGDSPLRTCDGGEELRLGAPADRRCRQQRGP